MMISDGSGTIEVQYLYSSIIIKMDRYNVYLKHEKLVGLKNLLLDCLRTLRENQSNKLISDWIKEKSRATGCCCSDAKNTMLVDTVKSNGKEACIKPPKDLRTMGPIGKTTLTVYLGIEDLSCFVRKIKSALLEIRLNKKAKQKCQ